MKSFSAKLLLFGEYGLMVGAKALAVPFPNFRGKLVVPDNSPLDLKAEQSAGELKQFASWFIHEGLNDLLNFPFDLKKLQNDIHNKLYFQSDVPLQYGVGSSGALCAALFHEYSNFGQNLVGKKQKHSLPGSLKQDFSKLESYFHGRSSGLDPLVSFFNQPVLLENKQVFLPNLDLDQLPWSVYLFDTGMTSATSPLVRIFLEKMEDPDFAKLFRQEYLPANDGAVDAFVQRDADLLFEHLHQITQFQLAHFSEMIPAAFAEQIQDLLRQNICVKLLGSGGGGYLLAFVPKGTDFPQSPAGLQVFAD